MKKIYIIGVGPGREDFLLPIAKEKIEQADCLMASRRQLQLFKGLGKEEVLLKGHFDEAGPYIKKYKNNKKIAVLVSGDPGMYSLLGRLSRELKPQDYSVIPGISTVQLAFARLGESWSDAKIISLHAGKINNLANEVKAANKIFLFTAPDFPAPKIAGYLLKQGLENRRAVVLENLSYPDERIIDTDLRHLSRLKGFGLCALIIEAQKRKSARAKLYGIGIGPGEPGLITLKAKEILERVDTVFVPKGNEDGASLAQTIVQSVTTTTKNFVELEFPMTKNQVILNRYWKRAGRRICQEIDKGREVAFVTIGDPLIYSTYVYLLKNLQTDFPHIAVETIPGISSFNACAARANFALVEGSERLAIVPVGDDLSNLRATFNEFDTVVLMKVGAKLNKVILLLKELGLLNCALLVSRLGHKDEKIFYDLTSLKEKKVGYLSVLIVKKGFR